MMTDPLSIPCPHIATEWEQRRDPAYKFCGALEGEPCVWAKRWDGIVVPRFHAERLTAMMPSAPRDEASKEAFAAAVMADGEV